MFNRGMLTALVLAGATAAVCAAPLPVELLPSRGGVFPHWRSKRGKHPRRLKPNMNHVSKRTRRRHRRARCA